MAWKRDTSPVALKCTGIDSMVHACFAAALRMLKDVPLYAWLKEVSPTNINVRTFFFCSFEERLHRKVNRKRLR